MTYTDGKTEFRVINVYNGIFNSALPLKAINNNGFYIV